MTDPFLKIRIDSKKYSKKHVLSNISLEINRGEVVSIMGASGSGKTTLARCIAGFEDFDGELLLDGQDISKVHPKNRRIGIVPQDGALFPHLNVEGNIGYGIKDRASKKSKIAELLEIVELDTEQDILTKKVDQLSGGQQQRVAVARALSSDPELIILDESFTSLDQWLRITVRKQILDSIKSTNTTVIVITHDIAEAFELADRIAVIDDGKLVQYDDSETLYSKPKSISIAQLVGATNAIEYKEELYGSNFLYFFEENDHDKTAEKVLMARPEQVQPYDESVHDHVPVAAQVKDIKVSGPTKHLYLTIDQTGETLISTDLAFAAKSIGEKVAVGFPDSVIVYHAYPRKL